MLAATSIHQEPVDYGARAPRPPEGAIALPGLFSSAEGSLEIDIGFGRGQSLFARHAQAPHARIVGIEIKTKWTTKVHERIQSKKIQNLRVFAADAFEVLKNAGPDACVDRVFVSFPDPWWKRRHQKRMVVNPEFVQEVARLLRAGGELFIQTDVEERFIAYKEVLASNVAFEMQTIDHNPFACTSNREVRSERDGLPVYRILARRRE
jgi:tRNA (guanine-N7-)-methyltransferase